MQLDKEMKLWDRLEEAFNTNNPQIFLWKLVNNASLISSIMESDGIISEARNTITTLNATGKKLSMSSHDREIDNALVYVFLKSLTTIPTKTKAYKMGLIDKNGKLIKNPKTKAENDAISNLDLLMFKIRDWLRPKLQYLAPLSWVQGSNTSLRVQNQFSNVKSVYRQFVVQRINNELWKILGK